MNKHTYIEHHKKTNQRQYINYTFGINFDELISIIGLTAASLLIRYYGGGFVYIPSESTVRRKIRNQQIRELYLSGEYTQKELAERFKLKEPSISLILGNKADRYKPERVYMNRELSQMFHEMQKILEGNNRDGNEFKE
jgi:hypothetical protein